jgi:hypothetical protein
MPSAPRKSLSKFQSNLTALVAHFIEVLPASVKTIVLDGQALTPAQVQAKLQSGLGIYTAADDAREAAKVALSRRHAAEAALRALVGQVEAFLRLTLGSDTAALAKVGITPPKKRSKPSAQTTAEGVAKARATRKRNQPAATPAPSEPAASPPPPAPAPVNAPGGEPSSK